MWTNHVNALKLYFNIIVQEWIRRGFVNNMKLYNVPKNTAIPWFVTNKSINMSHRASLLRKEPSYYKKCFTAPDSYMKYKYIWISKLSPEKITFLKKNPNKLVNISEFAEPV